MSVSVNKVLPAHSYTHGCAVYSGLLAAKGRSAVTLETTQISTTPRSTYMQIFPDKTHDSTINVFSLKIFSVTFSFL